MNDKIITLVALVIIVVCYNMCANTSSKIEARKYQTENCLTKKVIE